MQSVEMRKVVSEAQWLQQPAHIRSAHVNHDQRNDLHDHRSGSQRGIDVVRRLDLNLLASTDTAHDNLSNSGQSSVGSWQLSFTAHCAPPTPLCFTAACELQRPGESLPRS